MIFHGAAICGKIVVFADLERTLLALGFVRWTWDYEQVVYDHPYRVAADNYYLRAGGQVVGRLFLEKPQARLRLLAPVFARHHFPHGLDQTVSLPPSLETVVKAKMEDVETALLPLVKVPPVN